MKVSSSSISVRYNVISLATTVESVCRFFSLITSFKEPTFLVSAKSTEKGSVLRGMKGLVLLSMKQSKLYEIFGRVQVVSSSRGPLSYHHGVCAAYIGRVAYDSRLNDSARVAPLCLPSSQLIWTACNHTPYTDGEMPSTFDVVKRVKISFSNWCAMEIEAKGDHEHTRWH